MSKSRLNYATYTPELVAELKALHISRNRADTVKAIAQKLKLSPRQARAVYSKHVEGHSVSGKDIFHQPDTSVDGSRKIRRLFWDIETSPNIGLFWKAGWKLSIDSDNIIKERSIICIGWKWEGEDKAHTLHWDKNQDDKTMLTEFLKIANQADEIVHHNGDKFDMPWFKTRCLFHGLIPLSDYKTSDTLQWCRRKLYFNSNKLNYVAQFLGFGAKIKTEFGLWKDILLKNCPIAMEKMCTYCERDVILLENVWRRLSEVVPHKIHAGVLAGGEKWTSPKDGNTNVRLSKTRVTAHGTKQYQFQDKDNGIYYSVNEAAYRAYLKAKKS